MNDDFSNYEKLRDAGTSPEDVYREAARNGIDAINRIRLIRAVYSLSPKEAKEVWVRAEGEAESLDEYQGKIADELLRSAAHRARGRQVHNLKGCAPSLRPRTRERNKMDLRQLDICLR